MARLNISQSAELFGIHRSTLQRHIKEGRVSFEPQEDGQKLIDMSELIRVYGEPKNYATPATSSHEDVMLQDPASDTTGTTPDVTPATGVLEQKVEMLEQQLSMITEDKDYLRKENHRLLEIIEQQMRLLPAPKIEEAAAPPQKESISPQVVEKPDFAISLTQEGIAIEQDTSVNAQEGISQKRKDVSAPKVPQKKKNASQGQKKTKKKQGFFGGLFGGKK